MNIELTLLKEVIEDMVTTVQKKVGGDILPIMSKYEALRELGVIYELVISLCEKLDEQVLQDELSVIREKVVTATQGLLDS